MKENTNAVARRDEATTQPAVVQAPTAIAPMAMHELIPRMELARRLPRSPVVFAGRLREEVLLDPGPMVYHKPGKDDQGKEIEIIGPSIRMAEIAGRLFGNLDVGQPVITETETHVDAAVRALDLESNYCVHGTSSTSVVNRYGKRMQPHVIANLRLATAAKAMRNAIEKVVGKHVLKELVDLCLAEEAKRVKAAMEKDGRAKWWEGELKTWARFKITEAELFAALKVQSLADVTPEHAAKLRACMNTIKQERVLPRVALGLDSEDGPPTPAEAPPPSTSIDDYYDQADQT